MTKEYFAKHGNERFDAKNRKQVKAMGKDAGFSKLSKKWCVESLKHQYPHHFTWLGRPILQFPQDVVAMQEIIWKVKPDVIVETGIARGGSLIFYASMLELLGNNGEVIGIDVNLRKHNREALKKHPFSKKIKLVDGSSIDPDVAKRVHDQVGGRKTMVVLDSNHAESHVLQEMNLYGDLVTKGSYLIVSDTFLESFPRGYFPNRPWDKGDNPATAVVRFLKTNKRFENDEDLVHKLGITSCPTGYLKCIRK